jgi:hypothetical protein
MLVLRAFLAAQDAEAAYMARPYGTSGLLRNALGKG